MKKIKKGGKENEAASFYTADEFFLRKGYQIPDLVTEVRKEAYVSGFNRGQEQAYYGFWNKDCQKLFKEDEETRKVEEHEHCWTAHDEWQEHVARTAFKGAIIHHPKVGALRSPKAPCRRAVIFRSHGLLQIIQGTLRFPCAGYRQLPFCGLVIWGHLALQAVPSRQVS